MGQRPEEILLDLFRSNKLTLSLAESCTGGAVSARLVTVPDSSCYFLGSVVAYSNLAKSRLLGVSPSVIKSEGAVSEMAARQMALGAKRQFGSDVSAAITGIAGPTGGLPHKPVGTVCMAISGKQELVWTEFFEGNREEIIEHSVQTLIQKLISTLKV